MYKNIIKIALITSLMAITLFSVGCKSESVALQVNDVASDPGAFTGNLTVVGIVNTYAENDKTIVGLMDKKELQCTTANCSKVLLPVKIVGNVLPIGAEISVSGSFTAAPWGGKMLKADSVEVLDNHNLGG